jgi:RHS repeat-associated protein
MKMQTIHRTYLFFLFILLGGTFSLIRSQNLDTHPMRGFMPNMEQLSSPLDNIDIAGGKLHLQIPLASLPRGAGGTGFNLNLEYDSRIFDLEQHKEPVWDPNFGTRIFEYAFMMPITDSGGWTYNYANFGTFTIELKQNVSEQWGCTGGYDEANHIRYRVVLPDGSQHTLLLKEFQYADQLATGWYGIGMNGRSNLCAQYNGYPAQYDGKLTYFTNDGSFLKYEVYVGNAQGPPATLYFADGRRLVGNTEYDANGNATTVQGYCSNNCSNIYAVITNQSGKQIRIDYNTDVATINGVMWKRDTVTAPGPNGDVYYAIDWKKFHVGKEYIRGQNAFTENPEWWQLNFDLWGLKYVHLPNPDTGTVSDSLGSAPTNPEYSYEFNHMDASVDGLGVVNQMRVPSGAQYGYSYNQNVAPGSENEAQTLVSHYGVAQKTVTYDNGAQLVWSFADGITNPDGGRTRYNYANLFSGYWNDGLITSIDYFDVQNNKWVTGATKRFWSQNRVYPYLDADNTPHNPYMTKEIVSAPNSSGNLTTSAITTFSYDKNGNPLSKTEYDWVNYGVETGSTIKRNTQFDYYVSVPEASSTSDSPNAYWREHNTTYWASGTSRRLNAVKRRTIFEGSTAKAATEFVYDSVYHNGNVIYERRWDSVKAETLPSLGNLSSSNSQEMTYSYDAYGNLTDKYEPEVRTHVTYDTANHAFVTQVDTGYGTGTPRTMQYTWLNDGVAMHSKIDVDNGIMTVFEYDSVGRQTLADEQTTGESHIRKTETEYFDDVDDRKVKVTSDLREYQDGKLQSITYYDKLGRSYFTQKSDGSPLANITDGIKAETSYIYPIPTNGVYPWVGRYAISSTPYRSTSDATLEWTCTKYDLLGRVEKVAMFKGSSQPSSCDSTSNRTGYTQTSYNSDSNGKWITVTDPAGMVRKQRSDSLGRLVEVVEDPSSSDYHTTYAYDALDNLTTVTQGSQSRTFSYSSLGRLLSATNPESGTINYTYWDSGDLKRRTDARNIWSESSYDSLHRILTKTYSDGTPTATYEYWTTTAPNIGQLKSVGSSVASTAYYYDWTGGVTSSTHTINGYPGNLVFDYDWYLNGAIQAITYPSNKQVNYGVDDAGRTNKVYATGVNYADMTASGITYPFTADGRIAQMMLGNGRYETRDYNTPGTATTYRLGTTLGSGDITQLEYGFSGTQNNGNLLNQSTNRPNGAYWAQTFGYDNLNRLSTADETGGWSRTYGYDRYGNRWVSATTGLAHSDAREPIQSSNFSTSTNQLAMSGTGFDAAGNQTIYTPYTLSYDAESRNTSVTSTANGNGTFSYDGEGRRVKKVWTPYGGSAATTYYVYNALGQLAAEYSSQTPESTGTSYMFTDMLGSVRTITDQNGSVVECYDYLPFGRMLSSEDHNRTAIGCYPADPDTNLSSRTPQKFTGKERDEETGLDFFLARYYSGAQGRFTSPDMPLLDQQTDDPQSWNLYAYARNNPLRFTDPTGRCIKSANATKGTAAFDICQDTSDLKTDESGKDFIKEHEGLEKKVYEDTGGLLTVGYGHLVKTDDNLKKDDKVTSEKADALFDQDVPASEGAVRTTVGEVQLSQNEFNALTDLVFNAGPGVLDAANSPKLNEAIKKGDYKAMSGQLKYTKDAKGNHPKGLVTRSEDRKKLFLGTHK